MLTLMLALTTLGTSAPPSVDDFKWHGKIAAGKAIEIRGINGSIHASGTTKGEVEVTAVKHARRSDPDDVKIEVVETSDGVTICAIYPSKRGSEGDCSRGHNGQHDIKNNDVEVEFTVAVPSGVRFIGRTVNGGVDATDLDADADVSAVNGGVSVSTKGIARASTVNGSLTVSMGRVDWSSELELSTVNGSVNLDVPGGLNADFQAETVNGSIDSDFPITIHGRVNPRKLSGTIGSGGRELRLSTVNGNIRLRKVS